MSLSRGVSLIALHTGEIDEDRIWSMRYDFFRKLIREISCDLNYQAVAHLLGNPYAGKEGVEAVSSANPINAEGEERSRGRVTRADLGNIG